jgi:hypothetical protein
VKKKRRYFNILPFVTAAGIIYTGQGIFAPDARNPQFRNCELRNLGIHRYKNSIIPKYLNSGDLKP